jgi:lipopolysaccharide/colanic/teichoic acid biosynthesis glycosyltransferase
LPGASGHGAAILHQYCLAEADQRCTVAPVLQRDCFFKLNVMRGEMNIVGPRPERPTIFAELRGHIAEYPLRQRAKPGITGLAQINHHYDRSLDDVRTKVRYDLEYIRRQSLWEDLRIMLRTIPVILFRRGGW